MIHDIPSTCPLWARHLLTAVIPFSVHCPDCQRYVHRRVYMPTDQTYQQLCPHCGWRSEALDLPPTIPLSDARWAQRYCEERDADPHTS